MRTLNRDRYRYRNRYRLFAVALRDLSIWSRQSRISALMNWILVSLGLIASSVTDRLEMGRIHYLFVDLGGSDSQALPLVKLVSLFSHARLSGGQSGRLGARASPE